MKSNLNSKRLFTTIGYLYSSLYINLRLILTRLLEASAYVRLV